jgi:hypothetical protein
LVVLDSFQAYAWMFLLAAGMGALGGVGAELTRMRNKEFGIFVAPTRRPHGLQLGSIATVIVGAMAAVTVLYFFPPEIIVKDSATGIETRHYEVVKFVALALIAGLGGLAVVNSARQSVVAQLREQSARTTKSVAKAAVENAHLSENAAAADAASKLLSQRLPAVQTEVERAANETPPALEAVLQSLQPGQIPAPAAQILEERTPPTDPLARSESLQGLVDDFADRVRQSTQAGLEDRIQASLRTIDAVPQ